LDSIATIANSLLLAPEPEVKEEDVDEEAEEDDVTMRGAAEVCGAEEESLSSLPSSAAFFLRHANTIVGGCLCL
jgi:hypothetical protein